MAYAYPYPISFDSATQRRIQQDIIDRYRATSVLDKNYALHQTLADIMENKQKEADNNG